MNSLSIKKGDNVLVIAGKEKGKTGVVLTVNPKENTVTVKGINIISKHTKPRTANEKGGIIKKEGKLHASNVQVICGSCDKATRVSHKFVNDKKVRVCKKCGEALNAGDKKAVKSATKKTTTTAKKAPAKKAPAKKSVAKK